MDDKAEELIATIRLFDKGRDLKKVLRKHNLVFNEGLVQVCMLLATDRDFEWDDASMELVDADGFTGFDASDTVSSHPGWDVVGDPSEELWDPEVITSTTISNVGDPVTFEAEEDSITVRGFIVRLESHGASQALWSGVDFGEDVEVEAGDEIEIEYTVGMGDA